MKRTELWIFPVLVVAILGVCIYLIVALATVAAQIAVAVIAVVGGILAAVVKHGFDLERERRHAEFLAKQKNYAELLSKIGAFARKSVGASDELCAAHLASWAFGDLNVLLATNALMAQPGTDELVKLLAAIRHSLGEQSDGKETSLVNRLNEGGYNSDLLFAPVTTPTPGLTKTKS